MKGPPQHITARVHTVSGTHYSWCGRGHPGSAGRLRQVQPLLFCLSIRVWGRKARRAARQRGAILRLWDRVSINYQVCFYAGYPSLLSHVFTYFFIIYPSHLGFMAIHFKLGVTQIHFNFSPCHPAVTPHAFCTAVTPVLWQQ